jgi:outer membrane protein
MKRSIRICALITAALTGLAGLALAQTKLATLNSQEVLEKSIEGKKAIAALQAADKKYSDDITRLDDQIKLLQNRLTTQRLTLTVEAAASIQAEVQKKQTDRQRAAEDATKAMQDLQANTLARIQDALIPLIEQVRKDKGLDLIFDLAKSGTVYVNPAIDLTGEIVRLYDAMKAAPAAPPVKK